MFIVCVRSRERERLWMHFLPCAWWKKRAWRLVSVYSRATEQVSKMCTACLRACSPFTAIICRCCVIRSKGKQWCVHLASHRTLTSLHNADSNSKQQRPQRFEGTGWEPVRRRRERRWKSWIAVLDKYSISNTVWLASAKTPPHFFAKSGCSPRIATKWDQLSRLTHSDKAKRLILLNVKQGNMHTALTYYYLMMLLWLMC